MSMTYTLNPEPIRLIASNIYLYAFFWKILFSAINNSTNLIINYSLDIRRGFTTVISEKSIPLVTAISISIFFMLLA